MPCDPPNRLVVIHSLAGLAHCPRGADLRKLSLRLQVVVGIASAPTRLQKNLMSLQDAPKLHRLAGMHVIPIHYNRKTLLLMIVICCIDCTSSCALGFFILFLVILSPARPERPFGLRAYPRQPKAQLAGWTSRVAKYSPISARRSVAPDP